MDRVLGGAGLRGLRGRVRRWQRDHDDGRALRFDECFGPAGTARPPPHGNIVLYVTNQSFEIDPVDIAIEVDGQPVLDQYFDVGGQHNFERFVLRLAPGRHVLTARSIKGKASLRKSFSVTGKRWVTVSYWYYTKAYGTPTPRQLDFRIDDQPMLFD